jgi:tRNA uridine 5-carboxymethylaminomethyl modification enzyme
MGLETRPAGRIDDKPSIELGESLERIGFRMGRLKTGTPPRLDGLTIDYSRLQVEQPDNPPAPFSFMNERVHVDADKQLPTHLTCTNERVAKIVKDTLHLNRHVREETCGPRYANLSRFSTFMLENIFRTIRILNISQTIHPVDIIFAPIDSASNSYAI